MSTHCLIFRKNDDKSYDCIYCHADGYYEHTGYILNKYYNTKKKVDDLIALGDLSSIDRKLTPTTDWHSFDRREPEVCVAYGRDRHEKDVGPHHCTVIDPYCTVMEPYAEAYMYLYKNNEWYTYTGKWTKLSEVLKDLE